ncbi:MAG TPA: multiheme c-type cytochrome [Anaerohalosphaeraceae bacterium]|jgi:hypothetical protein|nr:multiheme c-type cytochrome [Anaerohalosphaeraceae bacterium]HRT52251.1 multiheme c-type cytochrome [Anaerohalosphaeraceae bacterium]HRT87374.1 multiheme c-type cytochrome [Anaerohalosphaeraceae bacterium]
MRPGQCFLLLCLASLVVSAPVSAKIFLPGMQPEEAGIEFAKVEQCRMCHANTRNGEADPMFSWSGGMMAQAMRDPIFLATLAVANQDLPGVGEFCLRCHAPRGWLENRSTPADATALNQEDMHGVSCDVCHRLIDPLGPEAARLIKDVPPSYGNAMMVADPQNRVRGPYGDGTGAMPHDVLKSEFHASGHLCGTCHDISNPAFAKDVKTQPVYSFGHIERTYSEWVLSDFARQGKDGSCQSCHYPAVKGGGQASRFGSLHRKHFVMHGPAGGSTWVQDAVAQLYPRDVDRKAFEASKLRANAMLKAAASLDLNVSDGKMAKIRITNLTGHKLPSGYPEGRRMWINVQFLGNGNRIVKEIGTYGEKSDTLAGQAVIAPTLLDPEETVVYEVLPGISESAAAKFNKKPGPSFHFVLNDIITKDNRIPPKGFTNEKFKEHLCEPVGKEYQDGQYWDDAAFEIPPAAKKVIVRLMYQSMSWEYLKFLVEENRTDEASRKLYDAWSRTGKCPPVVMAEIEKGL